MTASKLTDKKLAWHLLVAIYLAFGNTTVQAAPAYDPSKFARTSTTTPPSTAFVDGNTESLSSASSGTPRQTANSDPGSEIKWRGGGFIPAGYHPFGYKITPLGETFLDFGETCLECDVGRFLASVKTRKTMAMIQTQWLEVVRVSKKGQSMRVYRSLQELVDFCLAARLID